jgi:nucleoside-diphosphate-sugar epimerase
VIIGKGMIANIFQPAYLHDEEVIIFASGVSNSSGDISSAFQREESLLREIREAHPLARLVYFSTVSILDQSLAGSAYVHHKIRMEVLLRSFDAPCLICRTSNIVGRSDNPHTLMNHLVDRVDRGDTIELWEGAMRNLLDIEHLFHAVDRCLHQVMLAKTQTVNVVNPTSYGIRYIVSAVETHLGKKANLLLVDKGTSYDIPGKDLLPELFGQQFVQFDDRYLATMLEKYYPLPLRTQWRDRQENTKP